MRIPNPKGRRLAGVLAAGALALSSQVQAEPVSLTVDYTCTYPLIGDQPLTADISSDMPAEIAAGVPTGSFDIDVLATAKGDTRSGLDLVGATQVEGTATAQANISGNNLDLDLDVPISIPNQTVEGDTGSFQLTANGSTPSLTFSENNEGELVITVGDMSMNLIARDSAGTPVQFPNSDPDTGEFPVPCILDAGQDNVLHTGTVTVASPDPDITVSPTAVDFGDVQSGLDETQTVTVSNDGGGSLGINSISISGVDAGDYMQSNNCTTVAAGDSCQIDVTYFASGEGPSAATLSIDSTDPDEATVDVPLDGNAVAVNPGDIDVSPASVDFGEVLSGTNAVQTVTVSNTGGESLGINSVVLSGADASAFMQTNDCTTVAAGGSCSVELTFFASGEGARTATLSIGSTDPDEPTVEVSVTGTSIIEDPQDIGVSPASVDFGTVDPGVTATDTVTVTNNGGDPLDITAVSISGANAGDFMQTNDCAQLAADASCTVELSFTPSTEGARNATLSIDSNDPDTPTVDVSLTGEGASQDGGGVDIAADLEGETKLKNIRTPVPLSGMVDATVDLATGMLTADLSLDPTQAVLKLPFVRVYADIAFEQAEETTGTFNAGNLSTESRMDIVLTKLSVSFFGFKVPIGGGDQCRTIDPALIELESPADEPFSLQEGGPVEGTYTIPPVDNCGGLEGLLNPIMAGPGNSIHLNLTPKD